MPNTLAEVLRDIMADAAQAGRVLQDLERLGVLERGDYRYEGGWYGYYASQQRRDGGWRRVFRPVARIEEREWTGTEWLPRAVRFAPDVHSPAALLARLIEVHRERLQRVAALQPEADALAEIQRGAVR